MDDLNGLSWSSNSNAPANKPPPMSSKLIFPNVHQNSVSGRSTPLSAMSNRSNSPSKPAPSTGDSFANLVSFGSSASNKNLSLLEQQKRLEAEKARKEAEKRSHFESQYGGQNSQFWDSLEHGRTRSPAGGKLSQPIAPPTDEDDLLAAFNSKAPVDASTNFPIPSASPSPRVGTNTPQGSTGGGITMQDNTVGMDVFDDDDPFGLSEMKARSVSRPAPAPAQDDDDDFLGLLGKPVSEIPRQHLAPESRGSPSHDRQDNASPMPSNEVDRAIAELVDMGFPADKARQALRTTSSGTDVQGAVGWLLTTAHAEARQKSQGHSPANGHPNDRSERNQSRNRDAPSWMSEGRSQNPQSRNESRSPAAGERDPAQIAQQFGTKFLKSANTLWKTGSKKLQQAVNEFNAESDASQPKWMRDASAPREESFSQPRPTRQGDGTGQPQGQNAPSFTDEALLLDSGDLRPRQPPRPSQSTQGSHDRPLPSLPAGQRMQSPNLFQLPSRPSSQEPKSRLARFAAEEQSAQNYVSPARRKRPQPQAPPPAAKPDVDLFDSPAPSSNRSKPTPQAKPSPPPARSASIPVRPKGPPRAVPPVSSEALQSTHRHREKAAESYKRGDYAAAHQSFSTALGMLPDKHPITIMIRSNRAMTALKTGEPKTAIDDADIILSVIGNSKGEDEVIELGNGEPAKAMKDFYGKALMRKAEALEQLERWADAAQAWKLAVESGHGGSTSIQGRNRCEKAAGISKPPSKPSAPAKKRAPPAPKKASALSDFGGSTSGQDSQAVSRLREANQAAERADQEKFALTDSVDARITAWKGGKQENLRALLGSLDSVLWPEAGWKKVGLAELVLPNKVKINYMKGIAKVHPDKISTTATTEQRMIAGAVFGALNEAWDKFRIENNL